MHRTISLSGLLLWTGIAGFYATHHSLEELLPAATGVGRVHEYLLLKPGMWLRRFDSAEAFRFRWLWWLMRISGVAAELIIPLDVRNGAHLAWAVDGHSPEPNGWKRHWSSQRIPQRIFVRGSVQSTIYACLALARQKPYEGSLDFSYRPRKPQAFFFWEVLFHNPFNGGVFKPMSRPWDPEQKATERRHETLLQVMKVRQGTPTVSK